MMSQASLRRLRDAANVSIVALGLASCVVRLPEASPATPPGIQVPLGAYRFEAYDFYESWFEEVVRCVAISGADIRGAPRFEDLEFWAVPTLGFNLYNGGPFAGYLDAATTPFRLYVVDWDRENEGLIKHEMTHAVADTAGAHPSPPYGVCAPREFDAQPWRR